MNVISRLFLLTHTVWTLFCLTYAYYDRHPPMLAWMKLEAHLFSIQLFVALSMPCLVLFFGFLSLIS